MMKKLLFICLLGIATSTIFAQNFSVSGSNSHSVMICSNGNIFAWGQNNFGQLGVQADGTTPNYGTYSTSPVRVYGTTPISAIDAGTGTHTLALTCDGKVYAWGLNTDGQLGNTSITNSSNGVDIYTAKPYKVMAGASSALSGGITTDELININSITLGSKSSYAIYQQTGLSYVLAWGRNAKGELGNNSTTNSPLPVFVQTGISTASRLTGVLQIEAGEESVFALTSDGSVWSWGDDASNSELGRTVANNSLYAQKVVKLDGTPLTGIVSIAAGDRHCLAIDSKGNVWAWGANWMGQRGGSDNTSTSFIGSNQSYASLVLAGPNWISVNPGSVNLGDNDPIVSIAAGQAYSIVSTKSGKVWSFGMNGYYNETGTAITNGCLGIGSTSIANVGIPTQATYSAGVKINNAISVSDGDGWSFISANDGNIYAAGQNNVGQLGIGSTTNQSSFVKSGISSCSLQVQKYSLNLGSYISTCAGFSKALTVSNVSPNFVVTYSLNGVKQFADTATTGIKDISYNATIYGLWTVKISDIRPATERPCNPFPDIIDTIVISEPISPVDTLQLPSPGRGVKYNYGYVSPDITVPFAFASKYSGVTNGGYYGTYKVYSSASASTPFDTITVSDNKIIEFTESLTNVSAESPTWSVWLEDFTRIPKIVLPSKSTPVSSCTYTNIINSPSDSYYRIKAYGNFSIDTVSVKVSGHYIGEVVTLTPIIYGSKTGNNGQILADLTNIIATLPTVSYTLSTVDSIIKLPVGLIYSAINGGFTWAGQTSIKAGGPEFFFHIATNGIGYIRTTGCTPTWPIKQADGLFDILWYQETQSNQGSSTSLLGPIFDWKISKASDYPCGRIKLSTRVKNTSTCSSILAIDLPLTLTASSVTLCSGQNSILTSKTLHPSITGGILDFIWYKGNVSTGTIVKSTINTNSATSYSDSYNVPYSAPGTYTLLVRDHNNPTATACQYTTNVTIVSNISPAYSISGGGPFCSNSSAPKVSIVLTGTAPFNFDWSNGTTTSSVKGISYSPYTITPTNSGTYTITAINDLNCQGIINNSNSVVVTKIQQPDLVWDLTKDSNYCEGSNTAMLFAKIITAASPGNYSYNWLNLTENVNQNINSNSLVSPIGTKIYRLTITDSSFGLACNQIMRNRVVTQYPLPNYTITGGSTYCNGATIAPIVITITNGISPYILIYKDGSGINHTVTVSGTNPVSYSIPEKVAGVYQVVSITDASKKTCGAVLDASKTSTITINPTVSVIPITQIPSCATSSSGSIALSNLFVFGPTNGTVLYTCSDVSAINSTNFTKTNIQGIYSVTATYSYAGCTSSGINSITINSLPTVSVGNDTTICINTNYTLKTTIIGGKMPYSYAWSPSTSLSTATIANPVFLSTNTVKTTYTLSVTDANACRSSDNIVITAVSLPTVSWSTTNPTKVCSSDPITTLNVDVLPLGGLGTFTDKIGLVKKTETSAEFDPSTMSDGIPKSLDYKYTDLNGCVSYAPTSSITGINVLSPSPITITTIPSPIPTSYNFDVTSQSLQNVKWYSNPPVTNIGTGNSYTPIIPLVGSTPDSLVIGSYNYLFTQTISGCESKAVQAIAIVSDCPTQIPIANPDVIVCAGVSSVTVTASTSGTGILQWFNSANTSSATKLGTGNSYQTTVTNAGSYTYYVAEYNAFKACYSIAVPVHVTINSNPTASIIAAGTGKYCLNSASQIITVTPTGGVLTGNGITGQTFSPSFAGVGTYTLTYNYTDVNSCKTSATTSVTVNPLPTVIWAAANPTFVCSDGASVSLSVNATPFGGVGTFSSIAGLTKVTETSANLAPTSSYAGIKAITYSYSSPNGCSSTISTTINVFDTPEPTSLSISTLSSPLPSAFNFDATSQSLQNIKWYSSPKTIIIGTGNIYTPILTHTGTVPDSLVAGCHNYLYTQTINGCESQPITAIACITKCPSQAPISGLDPKMCFTNTGLNSTTLTAVAQGIGDLYWFNSPNLKTATQLAIGNSYSTTVKSSGTYTYYVAEYSPLQSCFGPATPVVLTANPVPTVIISTSKDSINIGEQVSLVATGASSYIWSTGQTTASFTDSPLSTKKYWVTGTNVNFCTNKDSIIITVSPISTITINSPTISSFTPSSGVIGSSVTITGTNFNTTANNNVVFFGATMATITSATNNSLTVTVPQGTSFQKISVTDIKSGLTAYSTKPFITTFTCGGIIDSTAFAPKIDNLTGSQPFSISTGDIDGDSKSDIVVVNQGLNTVSIYKNTSNNGFITFAPKVDLSTGSNPHCISIADIDGDGKLDLSVVNYSSNSVSIYKNTSNIGTIAFASKIDYTTGSSPTSISFDDFDGDGKTDLAVVNELSNTVSLFKNTSTVGSISFTNKVDFSTGYYPMSIAISDIDGDGKPDLAIANSNASNQGTNSISVLRNTSSSATISFASKIDFVTGSSAFNISIGDLDADGKVDIAVANSGSASISVFKNKSTVGTISLATRIDFTTGGTPENVSIADIDGDGKLDLAVANEGSASISVFKNTSTSSISFASKVDFATSVGPMSIAINDIDGDNKPDFLVANFASSNMSILKNTILGKPKMTSLSSASICSGGSISIPLTSTIPSTYTWNALDNANTSGEILSTQTSNTLNSTIVNNSSTIQTVQYSITPTLTSGCNSIGTVQTVLVTINPIPTVSISVLNSTINSGEQVNLIATGATSYLWNNGATTSILTDAPIVSKTYSVTGTTNNCSDNKSVIITVKPLSKITKLQLNCIAGTLSSLVNASQKITVDTLILTGTIDARDFKTMRDSMPNLMNIDLRAANIVAYTGTLGTSSSTNNIYKANTIPQAAFYSKLTQVNEVLTTIVIPTTTIVVADSAFMKCHKLLDIVLSLNVTALGQESFSECNSITTIDLPNTIVSFGKAVFAGSLNLTTITIPTSLNEISDLAFAACPKLSSVTFSSPSSISRIGLSAFAGSGEFLDLTIPNSIVTIADKAFQGAGLKNIQFEKSSQLTYLGLNAFNAAKIVSITIPSNLTSIEKYTFQGCSNLETVLFENQSSLITIGDYAFSLCKITSIDIPATVTTIGSSAFANSSMLQSIYVHSIIPVDLTLSSSVFSSVDKTSCKLYVPKGTLSVYTFANQWKDFIHIVEMADLSAKTMLNTAGSLASSLTQLEKQSITTLTLTGTIDARDFKTMRDSMPNLANIDLSGATIVAYTGPLGTAVSTLIYPANTVPQCAFWIYVGDQTLRSFKFPITTTSVGDSAFSQCKYLSSIDINTKIETIGNLSFAGCQSLTTFNFPNSLRIIGLTAFGGCNSLKSIVIPNSVTTIGNSAFIACDSLSSVVLPNSITYISGSVFCFSAIKTITIPASVVSINTEAFFNCQKLENVIFESSTKLLTISDKAFMYCMALQNIVLPTSLTSIGEYAFQRCSLLVNLNIPQSVSSIGQIAFASCSMLQSISIPSNITDLNMATFYDCSSLTTLTIPATVKNIYNGVFTNCSGLQLINALSPSPIDLSTRVGVFDGVNKNTCILYVPNGSLNVYKEAAQWKDFLNIQELNILSLSTQNLTLSGYANSTSVDVTSNGSWLATSDQSWLTVDPAAITTGDGKIHLSAMANNDGITRIATITVSGVGLSSQTITVTQPIAPATLYLSLSSNSVNLNKVQNNTANVYVTSNVQWSAVSNQGWLTFLPTNATLGNYPFTIFATPNKTIQNRSGFIIVSANGVNPITITVYQSADSFVVKKQIPEITVDLNAVSKKYLFSDYITYYGTSKLNYTVESDNIGVANAAVSSDGFGIIQYTKGTANLTIHAESENGASITMYCVINVTSSVPVTNCSSFTVFSNITNVVCAGESTGSIELSANGGKLPYNFKWSNTYSGALLSEMPAGSYSVIITDSNACTMVKTYDILEPTSITITDSKTLPQCSSSNGSISVLASGGTTPYTYKWIGGSTSTSITSIPSGLYSVTVSDKKGCSKTLAVDLNNEGAASITVDTVEASDCKNKTGRISLSIKGGKVPIVWNWHDAVQTQNRTSLLPGDYAVTVTDGLGCKSALKVTVPMRSIPDPKISLVTVSEFTGKNLVVWLKDSTDIIEKYIVYRETIKAGTYASIDSVLYADTSIYVDEDADPMKISWRYKLSAIDNCGNEHISPNIFKTINLQQNIGLNNKINLIWDNYEGSEYYTYNIYRQSKSKGVELIDSIPASVNKYTDSKAPVDVENYYVAIKLPNEINPLGKLKSYSGPFTLSLSNMAELELTDVAIEDNNGLAVYPNPVNQTAKLTLPLIGKYSIIICNSLGQSVSKAVEVENSNSIDLNVSQLSAGIYTIKIQGNKNVSTLQFVKE